MHSVPQYIHGVEGSQRADQGRFTCQPLEDLMTESHVPGVSIAVIKDFKIHWAKGYGVADMENGARVDAETLFQAGSVSKPVAAMAVLKAVQDGRFSLDDDINNILCSWKLPDGSFTKDCRVTPRMLASHTSGLGDGFGFPGYEPGDPLPTLVQILNGQPPSNVGPVLMERPPLSAMKYSGGGSTILQLALTDVIQQPFPQILQDYVIAPIGMMNSAYEQPLSSMRDRSAARGHDRYGRSMGAKWHVHPELFAAGLWTTPTDLAKFAIEVQMSVHGRSNRVLSKSTVQEMLNPVGIGDFAVGFMVEKRGQGWYIQHGGTNQGFMCLLVAHKLHGYGLVAMTNSMSGQVIIDEVRKRVERVYEWDSSGHAAPGLNSLSAEHRQ
jgi:CubicO group peptidase (beta-lactamase class C family)